MGNIYKGTLGLIGNTPLVEVVNVEKELGLEATLLVKLEYLNPALVTSFLLSSMVKFHEAMADGSYWRTILAFLFSPF